MKTFTTIGDLVHCQKRGQTSSVWWMNSRRVDVGTAPGMGMVGGATAPVERRWGYLDSGEKRKGAVVVGEDGWRYVNNVMSNCESWWSHFCMFFHHNHHHHTYWRREISLASSLWKVCTNASLCFLLTTDPHGV